MLQQICKNALYSAINETILSFDDKFSILRLQVHYTCTVPYILDYTFRVRVSKNEEYSYSDILLRFEFVKQRHFRSVSKQYYILVQVREQILAIQRSV